MTDLDLPAIILHNQLERIELEFEKDKDLIDSEVALGIVDYHSE